MNKIEEEIGKYGRPSINNFTQNSFIILNFVSGTFANTICFTKDNTSYTFSCDKFANGYDLQNHLIKTLNSTCDINLTIQKSCHLSDGETISFGSSGLGFKLCSLGYPHNTTPDYCITETLYNNTPTYQFGTLSDIAVLMIPSLTIIIGLAVLGDILLRHHSNKDEERESLTGNISQPGTIRMIN